MVGGNVDQGIITFGSQFKEFGDPYSQIATIVIAALPIAIIATIVLGVIARARPGMAAISGLLIVSGVLGLAASLLLFVALVANLKNGVQFIVALLTIVIVSVLLRLQRGIRRFFRRSPAVASLLFAGVTIFYLIISNGANISSAGAATGRCLALAAGVCDCPLLRRHAGAQRPTSARRWLRARRRQTLTP